VLINENPKNPKAKPFLISLSFFAPTRNAREQAAIGVGGARICRGAPNEESGRMENKRNEKEADRSNIQRTETTN
jgi:hypothetical protein